MFRISPVSSLRSAPPPLFRVPFPPAYSVAPIRPSSVHSAPHPYVSLTQILIIHGSMESSLQVCMDNFTLELVSKCANCNTYLIKCTTFVQTPPLLAFDLSNGSRLTLDPVVWILCENARVCYVLRGVIYFDNNHFTERVVTSTGMVWYYDGIFTGRSLVYETQNSTSIATENAVMAFYIVLKGPVLRTA